MQSKNKIFKITAATLLGVSLGLSLTACSNSNNDNHSQSTRSSKASKSAKKTKKAINQNETKLKRTDIKLSQTEALNKFDQKFKDKKIKSIDLKPENNSYVYEIDAVDNKQEYTATIDAHTGKILHSHSEKLDLDDRLEKTLNLDNVISRSQATKIAEKQVKGTAEEWNLEQEHNKAYWEVSVNDGSKKHEVKIDAESKKVISTDHDND